VTILQFRENLSDRQAAEAVRGRIHWKFLLGLELTNPGFDFSVLSEFRDRLRLGGAEAILLDKLLARCREVGLVKARGKQRTDSTRVLAAIRVLNRLELVAETLRAALNELATMVPAWLQAVAPRDWYPRYSRRIEDDRLPQTEAAREAYARTVGEDGFYLLTRLEQQETPVELQHLASVQTLRQVWHRHYEREETPSDGGGEGSIRLKGKQKLGRAGEAIESPYDPEARYRSRSGINWTGYIVHLSETCEEDTPHLITHVQTTTASVHEAQCTEPIHQALIEKGLPPNEHIVDSAYVDAELLVLSQQQHAITLIGPTRPNNSWQAQTAGAYDVDQFEIDWKQQQVRCPQGKLSSGWWSRTDYTGQPMISVYFRQQDCDHCAVREQCTRSTTERRLRFRPQAQYEALQAARQRHATEEGRLLYKRRAGIEGTISQAVRAFELRQTRYRGLAKTHLQHIATAAAINLDRIVAWLEGVPRAMTRTSAFAALAPA
jgi:transposase